MSKPKLTRRMMRRYQTILKHDAFTIKQYMPLNGIIISLKSRTKLSDKYFIGLAALHFAKEWKSRDIDLKRLERIVAQSGDAKIMADFAINIPSANVKRLQKAVMKTLDPEGIRYFMSVPGAHVESLRNFLVILEVMGD